MGPQRRLLVSRTITSTLESPGKGQAPGSGFGAAFLQPRGAVAVAVAVAAHWVIACANQPLTRAITPPVLARGAQAAQRALLPRPHVLLLGSEGSTEAEGMKKQHSSCLPVSFVFKG